MSARRRPRLRDFRRDRHLVGRSASTRLPAGYRRGGLTPRSAWSTTSACGTARVVGSRPEPAAERSPVAGDHLAGPAGQPWGSRGIRRPDRLRSPADPLHLRDQRATGRAEAGSAGARRRAGVPADAQLVVCVDTVEPRKAQIPRATSVFGLPELIDDGETGWLCEPRDARALDYAEEAARQFEQAISSS